MPEQDRRKQHARRARTTIERLDEMLAETRRLRSLLSLRGSAANHKANGPAPKGKKR